MQPQLSLYRNKLTIRLLVVSLYCKKCSFFKLWCLGFLCTIATLCNVFVQFCCLVFQSEIEALARFSEYWISEKFQDWFLVMSNKLWFLVVLCASKSTLKIPKSDLKRFFISFCLVAFLMLFDSKIIWSSLVVLITISKAQHLLKIQIAGIKYVSTGNYYVIINVTFSPITMNWL